MNGRSFDCPAKHRHSRSEYRRASARISPHREREAGFECKVCSAYVCSAFSLSGVQNRNHCPYCLSSRHLDWLKPGDRLSACKSPMKAVGVTVKASSNKYGPGNGELMLTHICTGCGHFSINRIAADDDVDEILAVYEASLDLEAALKEHLAGAGIRLLAAGDESLVRAQLLGWESANPQISSRQPA
jgi:hypothetical protein